MSKLRILNHEGDTTFEWELDNPESIKAVRKQFDRIMREGYMAFRVDSPTSGEAIKSFDPKAREIIMTAPMVGG